MSMSETSDRPSDVEKIATGWQAFFRDLGRRAIAFHAVLTVVSVLTSGGFVWWVFSEITDQLDQRIAESNRLVSEYRKDLNSVQQIVLADNGKFYETVAEINERLNRMEAQTQLVSTLLTEAKDEGRKIPTVGDFGSLSAPIGGPGKEPIFEFRPMSDSMPYKDNLDEEVLRAEASRLERRYRLNLQGGMSGEFDPTIHDVQVDWQLEYDRQTDDYVVNFYAYVVRKEEDDE